MTGRIIRGVGGLYSVMAGEDGALYDCLARGRFRKDGEKPMVGDIVTFAPGSGDEKGYLLEICPRKNALVRPAVANIDKLIIVLAARAPQPDWPLTDRMLMSALEQSVECLIAVNKSDLGDESAALARDDYAPVGVDVVPVSVVAGAGLDVLKSFLTFESKLGTAGLAGQSAVGKSSLLAELLGISLETGGLSRIERGRHTTRRVELLPLPWGGLVADTPGFSLLETARRDPQTVAVGWPEFLPHAVSCRFTGCRHIGEAGCAVAEAAEEGVISVRRLARYRALYALVKDDWDRRYR